MSNENNLILRTPKIPYELAQLIKVENIDDNIPYNDIINKYLNLGIEIDNINYNDKMNISSDSLLSKTVYINEKADDFLTNKAREKNISKNNLFIKYIISGIEQNKNLSNLQKDWFNLLNKKI